MNNLPVLRIPNSSQHLPDEKVWKNRFTIRSSSSNRVYVVAQHIQKGHWGCDCPGWKRHRTCKHLAALTLPAYERPYEVKLG